MINYSQPDLAVHPPRSARIRLGGYCVLPRMLDKCRAEILGKNAGYHYNCPLDQRFLTFAGIDAEALKAEVAKGLGDNEILQWIIANQTNKLEDYQIEGWSDYREKAAPADNETRDFFSGIVKDAGASDREDLASVFEILDMDDHASYGGKP